MNLSLGTEYILGSIVSGSGGVSKLGGSCATFLGYMGFGEGLVYM